MNLPPFQNPWTQFRTWAEANRARAEIAAIVAAAIGLIIVMFVITVVVIVRTLR